MATGDFRIDALTEQLGSLSINHAHGTGAVITYSFVGYSQQQMTAIESLINELSTTTGVQFRPVETGALLTYKFFTQGPTLADGSPASGFMQANPDGSGVSVWMNSTMPAMLDYINGSGPRVLLHETGHALGLKHPGHYSDADTGPYLSEDQATVDHTLMAYNSGNTDHFGDYDVLALQYLWGAGGSTPGAAALSVTSNLTTGSYFNDTFKLDINTYGVSTRVEGHAGIDQLNINVASSAATFSADLKQFVYTKADKNFAGVFLDSVERIKFTDKIVALDIDGNAGQAYRLYKAAFDRTPDKEGLGFWIGQLDNGSSLASVAAGFVASQEFQTINGVSPNNVQLVTSLYQHILGRAPDQSGLDFWTAQLDGQVLDKSHLLINFAESNENKIALTGQVEKGIEYTA